MFYRGFAAALALVVASASSLIAGGTVQWTGHWNGSYGTWTFAAPVCSSPACQMCRDIRGKLAQQSRNNQIVRERAALVAPAEPAPVAAESMLTWESYTVHETRLRQRKVCSGRTCYYVTEPYRVPIVKWRPVLRPRFEAMRLKALAKAAGPTADPGVEPLPAEILDLSQDTSLRATPLAVVDAMLASLNPARGEKLFDLGCGDGRFLIRSATKYETESIGVELNLDSVRIARQRALENFVRPLVHVFHGDVRDYDLSEADYAVMYLHGDLMESVVRRLPAGCKIASFMHPIPGIDAEKKEVVVAGKTYFYYLGEK